MRRHLPAAAILAGALVLAACGGATTDATRDETGQIADTSELGVFRMRVSDCFNSPEDTENGTSAVEGVPCDQPHDNEVYAVYDHDASTFPGDTAMEEIAGDGCYDRFADFTGGPYETSALFFGALWPSQDTWEGQDDREIICYVYLEAGQLTGTARGYDEGAASDAGDAASGSGSGTAVSVFGLITGDCFDTESIQEGGGEQTVDVIDCSLPHDNEVFHLFDMDDGDFPGDDAVETDANEGCVAQFEAYVGIGYDDSAIYVRAFYPSVDTWADGDREVVCMLYDPDGEKFEGSMRGAAI